MLNNDGIEMCEFEGCGRPATHFSQTIGTRERLAVCGDHHGEFRVTRKRGKRVLVPCAPLTSEEEIREELRTIEKLERSLENSKRQRAEIERVEEQSAQMLARRKTALLAALSTGAATSEPKS